MLARALCANFFVVACACVCGIRVCFGSSVSIEGEVVASGGTQQAWEIQPIALTVLGHGNVSVSITTGQEGRVEERERKRRGGETERRRGSGRGRKGENMY